MWEELIFRLVLEIFLELLNTFYTLRRRSPALYNSIMKVCLTDIPRQKKVHIHFQAKMDTCESISWEGQSQGSVRWASVQEFLNIQQWLWKTAFCFLLSSLANITTPIPYPSASSSTPGFINWSPRLWCTSLLQERRGRRRKKATGRNRLMCETCQQCCSDWSRGVCKNTFYSSSCSLWQSQLRENEG